MKLLTHPHLDSIFSVFLDNERNVDFFFSKYTYQLVVPAPQHLFKKKTCLSAKKEKLACSYGWPPPYFFLTSSASFQ